MQWRTLEGSARQTLSSFLNLLPVVAGMLLLTSLVIATFPRELVSRWFGRYAALDVLLGAGVGSVAAGHPLASYILGGELPAGGVSLLAVTALLVSWVTVGIVQLPAEALWLGRRFALYRNLVCFASAVGVSLTTVLTLELLDVLGW